jgi:hypothetical protein
MHDSAEKMDKCIQALGAAIDTASEEEGDKLVDTAVKYLEEIAVDIEKALM